MGSLPGKLSSFTPTEVQAHGRPDHRQRAGANQGAVQSLGKITDYHASAHANQTTAEDSDKCPTNGAGQTSTQNVSHHDGPSRQAATA
ncbi:MAG: hypothetical protein NZO58_00475 [Gemmataceae bacterium]|nr:hypothetical protein [Gemmataceae bacterium]